jgi:hypothetical protein
VAKPDIKKECDYTVGDGNVTLVVTIGNGNLGTIDVFLEGDAIEPVPGTNTWNLGSGTDLDQKTLEIDSGVTPLHDIIVTAELAGGPQKGTCIAKGSTTHNPATVQILIDFSAE